MAVKEQTIEHTATKVKEPKRYMVVMHNDDYTPMDFVVEILIQIFGKEHQPAVDIMYRVHKEGKAAIGNYPYDIARTKVDTAIALARQEGYPFQMTIEEV